MKYISLVILGILLVSCTPKNQMANPASVFCEENKGSLKIIESSEGQKGICILPSGKECEEWAYYRGECKECSECPLLSPPSPDYCKGGELVGRTEDECGCQGAPECRYYLTKDPEQCAVMGVWECEPGRILFTDDAGCGCIKDPDFTTCTDPRPEFCTEPYDPVCGLLQIQCIKAPCYPIPQDYGNGCEACNNEMVIGYTQGECT